MTTKIGTPYYVCPEILNGKYDNSCDVWSIGIITYFMLSGYPPFNAKTETQLFKKIMHYAVKFDDPEWQEISSDAKDFIYDLLKKSGSERPTPQ
jgi:calcium-dependent protein kinase